MLKKKAFAERTTFLDKNFTFLAQVLSLERKCVYGYDPLLSKEKIEGFGVKALDNLDVKIKMDGVIVAVAHDEFKNKPFLKKKAFSERTTFLEENFTFLAQVLSLERKCFIKRKSVLM